MSALERVVFERIGMRFGKRVIALDGVDLALTRGEVVGLAGPNGSGKSTLIRILLGLVRPTSGRLLVDGEPRRVDNALKARIGYLPESVAFSENLSARQVLCFFAAARRVHKQRVDAVLERVGLDHAAKRAVRGYSRGMRQRLGLAVAMLAEPQLLILDEPTGGLDQQGLSVLREVISEQQRAGKMLLVATHDLGLMERHLDRVCLLQDGQVLADDTPKRLRELAALPIRVTFALESEQLEKSEAFVERLRSWQRGGSIERRNGEVVAEVQPPDLLALVELRREHEGVVRGISVEQPGMDAVYEQLLRAAAERG